MHNNLIQLTLSLDFQNIIFLNYYIISQPINIKHHSYKEVQKSKICIKVCFYNRYCLFVYSWCLVLNDFDETQFIQNSKIVDLPLKISQFGMPRERLQLNW